MFMMVDKKVPDDTVLLMGISYAGMQPGGDTRGRSQPKVFTYAGLKTGGLWYLTGSGQVPQAAGWGAVMRWLERDGRKLEWVKLAGVPHQVWPVVDTEVSGSDTAWNSGGDVR